MSETARLRALIFCPHNSEIVEQLRQIERATERRMVAVREIRFPGDATPAASTQVLGSRSS